MKPKILEAIVRAVARAVEGRKRQRSRRPLTQARWELQQLLKGTNRSRRAQLVGPDSSFVLAYPPRRRASSVAKTGLAPRSGISRNSNTATALRSTE